MVGEGVQYSVSAKFSYPKRVFRILCHFDNLSKKDNTALNRLTSVNGSGAAAKSYSSFDYDTRGNITNNSHVEMSYNLANQMTAALGKSYSYDGHNRRVKVAGDGDTRYYFYSQSGQLLLSEDNGVQTNYIYLGSKLIAEDRQATTTFIHTDRLGSPVARTNSTGRVESRRHYQPFGDTYEAPNDDIGYTGHKYDNDLGLSYMQARYYDPVIGRFYSNDPVGMTDVHSFNRYTYANNNPYKYIDPTGMKACEGQSGNKCIEADPVNDKLTNRSDVQGTLSTDTVAVNNMDKFAVPKGTTEKGGYIKDGQAVAPDDVQTGQTNNSYTASIPVPKDADAVIHGHPDVDPSGIDSPGDANAPLNYNKPNYVVTKGRVGVTELVGGRIRVRMVKGKMTRKERRALQKNINNQQKNYGN